MKTPIITGLAVLSMLAAGLEAGRSRGWDRALTARWPHCSPSDASTATRAPIPRANSTFRTGARALAGGEAARRSCRESPTRACSGSASSRGEMPPNCAAGRKREVDAASLARSRRGLGHRSDRPLPGDHSPPGRPRLVVASAGAPPAPPPVRRRDWVRTPIDRFILNKLEANGLSPAAEAERRALIRRVCFDLTGLAAGSRKRSTRSSLTLHPQPMTKMVERYLASPQYGVPLGALVARPGPVR